MKRFSNRVGTRMSAFKDGAMYFMLHICRLFGIAPVKFEEQIAGRYVSVSLPISIFNFLVIIIVDIGTLSGLVLKTLRPNFTDEHNLTRWYVWVADFGLVIVYMSVSVYRAPRRLEEVIRCLDQIYKFNVDTPSNDKVSDEVRRCGFIVIFAGIATLLVVLDYVDFILHVTEFGLNMEKLFMYSCEHIGKMIIQIMEMQFIITNLVIHRVLNSLNDLLEEVGTLVKEQDHNVLIPNNFVNVASKTSIGNLIDTLAIGIDKSSGFTSTSPPHLVVHLLHSKYHQLCSAVQHLNRTFGLELLFIIASCIVHLITSSNAVITCIITSDTDGLLLAITWCAWYLFCTLAVVEQGHMIEVQMGRTKWVVSDLIIRCSDDLVQEELRKFSRFLVLNNISYTPMGACTLNRDLAVSILSSVTTYLIIIFQFQQSG